VVNDMKFSPFKSINGIPFNYSKDDIIQAIGNPENVTVNNLGWEELNYDEFIFRLDKKGKLVEVTANLENVDLNGIKIQYRHLKEYLSKNDNEVFDRVGFTVSPRFGIAFDSEHQFWVTHFRQSELEGWCNVSN